jgi:secreted trypsin-like serine protease
LKITGNNKLTTSFLTKTMKNKNLLFLFILLVTLTSGIYRHDQPIEKYLALANQEKFNCVGQILNLKDNKWESIGSFVLIDSATILSAAHCFIGETKKDTVVDHMGKKYKTYVARGRHKRNESEFRFHVMNMVLSAKSIIFHPNYLMDGNCDLALIKLEKPLSGIEELSINNLTSEMKDTVTGVGFGVSGPANQPELVKTYHIKMAGNNIIDSIGGALLNGQNTMLFADFDSPDMNKGCNIIGNSKPLELEYSIGAGDSGGPLFGFKGNKMTLFGIAAYAPKTISNLIKNGYYCELNGWTRLSAFTDWIKNNR